MLLWRNKLMSLLATIHITVCIYTPQQMCKFVCIHWLQLFFARARAMAIIPTSTRLPGDGPLRLILIKAARVLTSQASERAKEPATPCTPSAQGPGECVTEATSNTTTTKGLAPGQTSKMAAAQVLDSFCRNRTLYGCGYFSRAWTLVERTARFGRGEALCNFLSLESWIGMVVDALLQAASGDEHALAAFKRMVTDDGHTVFDMLVPQLAEAIDIGSILMPSCNGIVDNMARLMEISTEVWAVRPVASSPPDAAWVLRYLLDDIQEGIYQATHKADLVWSVYTFLSAKWDVDLTAPMGLRCALEELAYGCGLPDDPRGAAEPALNQHLNPEEKRFTVCANLYEVVGLEDMLGEALGPIKQVRECMERS